MRITRFLAVFTVLALFACTDDHIASPDLKADAPPGSISVLNWNVYVGTDVDAIILALADGDPTNDMPILLAQLDTLFLTDWSARAGAIADAIAARRPHAVGLQEISTFDLSAAGLPPLEFLPVLEAALAQRGLNYVVADQVLNIEAEYTIVSAHPEPDLFTYDLSELRAGQATEIVTVLGQMGADRAIVMGDLNDHPGSLLHQVFAAAGFEDVWAEMRPGVAGYTCCHAASLSNRVSTLVKRIDYVLARGIGHPVDGIQGRIDILGEVPADRVAGPAYRLWPSDHAGLAAELLTAPAIGLR
jgi:endonuclease/exonuclease/phosphatase (EEP) superfamily protein YafD